METDAGLWRRNGWIKEREEFFYDVLQHDVVLQEFFVQLRQPLEYDGVFQLGVAHLNERADDVERSWPRRASYGES